MRKRDSSEEVCVQSVRREVHSQRKCLVKRQVSRVSVRGTLSDTHYEIVRTRVETPNSTH